MKPTLEDSEAVFFVLFSNLYSHLSHCGAIETRPAYLGAGTESLTIDRAGTTQQANTHALDL
jgi:hypothetical protein